MIVMRCIHPLLSPIDKRFQHSRRSPHKCRRRERVIFVIITTRKKEKNVIAAWLGARIRTKKHTRDDPLACSQINRM